jgi:hypothetical protein
MMAKIFTISNLGANCEQSNLSVLILYNLVYRRNKMFHLPFKIEFKK